MNSGYDRTLNAANKALGEFDVTCEICHYPADLIRFKNKYVCLSCRDHIRESSEKWKF
jgi:hypothetical protein